ncbi:MAG: formylglycine-generating enzyme family protein [Xanthomonadales bacterium]|nr:formylglycine-generating enzyme family protein [Xanthomonadales bacterium]
MAKEQIESRKELIRNTQIELMRLGRDVSENGVLDKATAMAISEFQRWTDRERTSRPNSALLEVLKATDDWPSPIPGEVFRDCPDCPEMVVIPSGSFQMGSPSSEPQRDSDEGPQHRVSVPAFALAKTEVTFAQWDACVSDGGCSHRPEDRGWGRGNRPVMNVNWNDAQEYVRWLSRKTGADYRLPSEAEWEYAARAGTTTRFNTGNCITSDQANFNGNYPPSGCSGVSTASAR